jgi:PAS domain-containing protein
MFNGGVWVSGPDGTVIASNVPTLVGASYADRDYMVSVLKDNKPAISKPITGKVLKDAIFAIAVPIHDANGKVIGALAGVTDLGKPNFLDNFVSPVHGKQGGSLLAAPKHRLIITATDKALAMQAMPALDVNQMFDRYADGYEGYGISVNAQGLEELIAGKGVPIAGWVFSVATPATEAFAAIHSMQQRMLLATLALTLLAGVLTWWTLRRQLAPLMSAVRALAKLSEPSQLPQPLSISRKDEIGNLIEGFNRLMAHRQALQDDLQATLNASPDLIFDVGIDGRLYAVHTRSAHLLVASAHTLIDKLVQDVLPADAAATIMDTLSEANARGYSSGQRICLALPTGVHWFELSGARKPPLPGQMQRFIVISRDISERNRAEKDLRQALASVEMANQSKSRFLAAASHDLRQPMAALALYTGMLSGVVKPGQDKLVSHIQTCVDSLSGMLDDLLDLSKFDAGVLGPL